MEIGTSAVKLFPGIPVALDSQTTTGCLLARTFGRSFYPSQRPKPRIPKKITLMRLLLRSRGCSAKVPHTPKYYYNFHRIRWQHEPNGQESCWGTLMLQSTPYTTLPCVPGADVSLLSTASLQTSNGMRLSHVLKFPKRNPSTWKYRVQTDTAILRRLTWPHVWFTKSPPADEHDEGVSMHTPKTRDSCLPTLLSSHRQNNLGENTNL